MSVTPLSAGLKNWHWRQKQVDKWAYDWFKTNAPSVRGSDATAGIEVAITGVKSIEGDVTVGQRKSKVVTIYDLDMTLGWTATVAADETTLEGTVQIPEVSHEAIDGLSDYAYNFTSPSSGTPPYLATRKLLPTLLEPFFSSFRDALVDVHGKDMIAAPEPAAAAASASASGSSTPGAGVASASSTPATAANPTKDGSTASSSAAAKINTSTVLVRAELRISAADLWSLLTDEAKIPSWSRSAAQFSPTPGAPFALFGGSVKGRILSAEKPTTFSSTWALVGSSGASGWPAGHEGTLEVKLEQGQEATTASFTLEGVPRGREKEMESNLHAFYIRGFVAMGLGSDLNAAMNM